jgi:hypothetical protein
VFRQPRAGTSREFHKPLSEFEKLDLNQAKIGTKGVTGEFTHGDEGVCSDRESPRSQPWRATMATTMQENLTRQLCDSIERLQKQVEKVEFWASAVTGFTQPVPDYEPETSSVARYVKPGRPAKKRRRRRSANPAAKQNDRARVESPAK